MAADEANRKRKNQVKFYLDEEEKQKFMEKIQRSCLSKSEYIRKCILGKQIKVVDMEMLEDYLAELGKIGSNLNQLARASNSGMFNYINEIRLETQLKELETLKYKILNYIEKR